MWFSIVQDFNQRNYSAMTKLKDILITQFYSEAPTN
jgi:hypothetical protein